MNKIVKFNSLSGYAGWSSSNASATDIFIATKLHDLLPHGSGINSDWWIEIGNKGVIKAHNTFSAMDEMGGYCHDYRFNVAVKVRDDGFYMVDDVVIGREYKCCGFGLRTYLTDTIAQCLGM